MKVFRGYMRIVARNLGLLIMYISISVGVVIGVQESAGKQTAGDFTAVRQPTAVIDREGGLFGNVMRRYIAQEQELVELADDEQAIQDEMFYRNVSCVIIVPEDAGKAFDEGRAVLQTIQVPGSSAEYYMEANINSFLNQIRIYRAGGFSLEEACEKALALPQKEASVKILDVNGNKGERPEYNYFFAYLPYGFLSGMIMCLSTVILEFKKREVKRRINCSPVSVRTQSLAAVGCFLTVGFAVWTVCAIIQAVRYRGGIFTSPNGFYYVLNSLDCMAVAMGLAYLSGMAVNNLGALNGISNVLSLGLCFLGGVFVPIEMLGSQVEKVSVFLPTYWYSRINGILGDFGELGGELSGTIRKGLLIQLLFAVASFGVTMAVNKARTRE